LTPGQQQFIALIQHIISQVHQVVITSTNPQPKNIVSGLLEYNAKTIDAVYSIPDALYLNALKEFVSKLITLYTNQNSNNPQNNIRIDPHAQNTPLLTTFTSHLALTVTDLDILSNYCLNKTQSYQQLSAQLTSLLNTHDAMFTPVIYPSDLDTHRTGTQSPSTRPLSPPIIRDSRSTTGGGSTTSLPNFSLQSLQIYLQDNNCELLSRNILPTCLLTATGVGVNGFNSNNNIILNSLVHPQNLSSFGSIMLTQLLTQYYQAKHQIRVYHLIGLVIKAMLAEIAAVFQSDANRTQQLNVLLQKQAAAHQEQFTQRQ